MSTVPDLHIALTGIEKVVESLVDLPPLLNLLIPSAIGQIIFTYVNGILRPVKIPPTMLLQRLRQESVEQLPRF